MNPFLNLMTKVQVRNNVKKAKRTIVCNNCEETVTLKREVSIFNILFFVIIGFVVYMITKNKLSCFVPVVLSIINSLTASLRCPKCKKEMDIKKA